MLLHVQICSTFLVFCQLQQLVPALNEFLTDHPLGVDELTPEQDSELLGGRMAGRWKSVSTSFASHRAPKHNLLADQGALIFSHPTADDPILAADPSKNNNFTYLFDVPDPGAKNHFN
jgi:hypothetical protein